MREQTPSRIRRFASATTVAALAVGLCPLPALAGRYDGYDPAYDARYQPSDADYRVESSHRTDFAQVVSSRPIIRQVAVTEPRRQCWDEQVSYREPAPVAGSNVAGSNVAGAIIGGVIGGVAGHQFGGGSGRAVATGVGAVVGAGLGSHAGEYPRGGAMRTGTETRCETVDDRRFEDRIDGYDVTYRYNGNLYQTTMPYDPGNRIAVDVDVRPARY